VVEMIVAQERSFQQVQEINEPSRIRIIAVGTVVRITIKTGVMGLVAVTAVAVDVMEEETRGRWDVVRAGGREWSEVRKTRNITRDCVI
jgi:predicted secreted protein